MTIDFDPYQVVREKLATAITQNGELSKIVKGFVHATQYKSTDILEAITGALDEALKKGGLGYSERLQVRTMLRSEAEQAREEGTKSILRRQMAQHYEGR